MLVCYIFTLFVQYCIDRAMLYCFRLKCCIVCTDIIYTHKRNYMTLPLLVCYICLDVYPHPWAHTVLNSFDSLVYCAFQSGTYCYWCNMWQQVIVTTSGVTVGSRWKLPVITWIYIGIKLSSARLCNNSAHRTVTAQQKLLKLFYIYKCMQAILHRTSLALALRY